MNILTLLSPRKAPPPPPRRLPTVRDDEERALGCGWYDSSHELRAGLQVREHAGPEALARELPLALWLELELQGRPN